MDGLQALALHVQKGIYPLTHHQPASLSILLVPTAAFSGVAPGSTFSPSYIRFTLYLYWQCDLFSFTQELKKKSESLKSFLPLLMFTSVTCFLGSGTHTVWLNDLPLYCTCPQTLKITVSPHVEGALRARKGLSYLIISKSRLQEPWTQKTKAKHSLRKMLKKV